MTRMHMITIKKATQKDSQILAKIFQPLYAEELKSEEKIRTNIINGSKEYYICFLDKIPVGALSLKFDDDQCELDAIAVTDKGKGYGLKLLRFAENLADKRKCTKIWCYSLVQHGVEDFYKKHGWIEVELIKDFYPGKDCYKFSKSLILR